VTLRICFLAGTLGRGGAERQLVYMIRALVRAGVSVRVLSLTRGEAYEQEIRDLGVEVAFCGASGNKAARAVAIVRELRREPADIVQCAQLFVNLYAAAGARACGAIEIGAVRTDLSRDLVGAWWLLGRISLRVPRFLIANSRAGVRAAQRFAGSPERVLLLENVLDTEKFHPPLGRRDRSGPVRVLFMGRLVPQKRADRFLRAFAQLERRHPGAAEAWIAGAGYLRAELERYASSLGLTSSVRFLGEQADAAELLRQVDLVVMTSDWEGQPNSLIEAMGTGLPVLSTRMGAVDEIVPSEAGVVVPVDDEQLLADKLCVLVGDRTLREELGKRGLAHVRRELSVAALEPRLLATYEQVLSRGRRGEMP
jgi:glycosyltransferase involved in cell wall biosynthesis